MNTINNIPFINLITTLSKEKNKSINYDDLKKELQKKDDNKNLVYKVNIKDDDDLSMIYYNDSSTTNFDQFDQSIEHSCRSYIIEKNTLRPIASQFNRIIYNEDALQLLTNCDWSKVVVQKCYEGTMMLVFYHNNKWYITTRRCLDANESKWINNKSYREMFDEVIANNFTLDTLDKRYCYHFVLVHYQNKNIVSYTLEKEYKYIYHVMTTEKYTLKEVDYTIENNKILKVKEEYFDNLNSLYDTLKQISITDKSLHRITAEGYVLKLYNGEKYKSGFIVLKMQTHIYQQIMKIKPNNSNIHQSYLELYQKDRLTDFLPYFTRYNKDIINRINKSMQIISQEILELYHCTRQKQHQDIYKNLGEQYKKILYTIHGLYIKNKKKDYKNLQLVNNKISRSINVHDVYHILKVIKPCELKQIFQERLQLLEDKKNFYLKDCTSTMTLSFLMFPDKKKIKGY